MNRRQFLASTCIATVAPQVIFSATRAFDLHASAISINLVPGYDFRTEMLGFNGSFPGPEIRASVGQALKINVHNDLDEGTAVHWHGIRLQNAMDGVPVLTQKIQEPKTIKTYEFTPPDAGTYWYHSHYNSQEQVARGLAGPLIIEEAEHIDLDGDVTVVLSDWLLDNDGQLVNEFNNMHSIAHEGFMGNYARAIMSTNDVKKHDRIRLRLINAATNRVFPLKISGATGKIVALDGMALEQPRDFAEIIIAPAQRVDLILDVKNSVTLDHILRDGLFRLGELQMIGINDQRKSSPIIALPKSKKPSVEKPSRVINLRMMGGAMGRAHGGNNIWSFNNVSDLPDEPWQRFESGEMIKISLENQTSFPHAIHLHGHHFYELHPDGKVGDFRDTTLIEAGENKDILCRFDNPGNWMLHCHMLSHSIGGMKTWVKVG